MFHSRELLPRAISLSAIAIAITVAGGPCSDQGGSAPEIPDGPLAQYLTGAAADQLNGDGTLRIANVQTVTTRPRIDETRAREIASAFIASHLRGLRPTLERDRGAPIDVDNVAVCPRVLYAESAFGELPAELPGVYHRMYGPWWLTSLCTPGGEPVVALGVSAYATELGVSGGKLTYPDVSGGEFRVVGVRPGRDNLLPLPPEAAVRRAAGVANRRVASIPRLVLRRPGTGYPQLAYWQLVLDSETDVRIAETGTAARTRELFVGAESHSGPRVRRAAPEQPDGVDVEWHPWPVPGGGPETPIPAARTARLARRAGIPVVFHEVGRRGRQ